MRPTPWLCLLAALWVMPVPGLAGEPLAQPSTRQIIDALKPAPPVPHLRGITVETPTPSPTSPPSIDMRVNFEFNSARLSPDARSVLDRLSEALNSPELTGSRFQVAGHTDAVGSDSFNQHLSELRAQAVKRYLSDQGHVAGNRIDTAGYGESRLLDPAHPDAAINRRVQITNIGP